jgi:hypothetical protein
VAFGLSSSTISYRFIRASARALRPLCERRLDDSEFVALRAFDLLAGKTLLQRVLIRPMSDSSFFRPLLPDLRKLIQCNFVGSTTKAFDCSCTH